LTGGLGVIGIFSVERVNFQWQFKITYSEEKRLNKDRPNFPRGSDGLEKKNEFRLCGTGGRQQPKKSNTQTVKNAVVP